MIAAAKEPGTTRRSDDKVNDLRARVEQAEGPELAVVPSARCSHGDGPGGRFGCGPRPSLGGGV